MHQPTIRRAARDRLIDIRELGSVTGAEVLARDAVREEAKVLVAAGGDGTVSAVARTAAEHDIPWSWCPAAPETTSHNRR